MYLFRARGLGAWAEALAINSYLHQKMLGMRTFLRTPLRVRRIINLKGKVAEAQDSSFKTSSKIPG